MSLDRRQLLKSAAAAAAIGTGGIATAVSSSAFASQSSPTSQGRLMRQRAQSLLSSLDENQRTEALFDFNSPQRKAWNFMLGSRRAPGLALEQMNPEQKDLALDLLTTATSTIGMQKAEHIMLQQDILRDEWGKGSPDRNRERFSVQIYGDPSPTGAWSWRWEGHHLSLTFTLLNDQIISTTPAPIRRNPIPSHRDLTKDWLC